MAIASILVVLSDRHWTQRAIHLACALARNSDAGVTLIKMSPVIHAQHLGVNERRSGLEDAELAPLYEYRKTAEDYGVPMTLVYLHYAGYVSGLVSAVEQLDAIALLAPAAVRPLAFWARFQDWRLRRALSCPLFTLGADDLPASVVMSPPAAAEQTSADLPTSPAAVQHS